MAERNSDVQLAILGGNPDGRTAFSVAARRGNRTAVRTAPVLQRVDLAELVRLCLLDLGAEPASVREVRVDRGPGSYIGLRVAVTFARCFAAFGGCRLSAACSMEVAAVAAMRSAPALRAHRVCVLLDGRQGRAQFVACSLGADGRIRSEAPPTLLEDAVALRQIGSSDLAIADASLAQRAADPRVLAMSEVPADTLFDPSLRVETASLESLEPLYLTGSYVGG